ncbi:hypothetical protein NQ314_017876 [Rhamnusium bicolor]|uniref:C3H1-type domain-containing protein n=1 Tax=Rhamnusium bicolor TaxID=1586634 RepID=A0AAV8WTB6_9CUCU|nr:hypothetical protein NQ314_017876 [Rhamnusium bicolor]
MFSGEKEISSLPYLIYKMNNCGHFCKELALTVNAFYRTTFLLKKMPACKFYLEGSCSRDDCPYLHVRISPKADICRNFLEGFCKEAAECDKRHQFLCPDYEKTGNCLKQRCPYPHGKMVRKYSVFNKNKFAKKSSEFKKEIRHNNKHKESNILIGENISSSKSENLNVNHAVNVKTTRYYVEQKVLHTENLQDASNNDQKILMM